jgi:MATE family, multidrug efflux pump
MAQHTLRTESLVKLTWPIFLQNMTHSVVVLTDFYFFSVLSDEVAGTIGGLLPIIWMGAFVIPVFAGTGVSVASQYMGAKQHAKVVPAYMMNLTFTAVTGAAYAAFLWWFAADIGRWMGLNPALNAIGTTYLSTMSGYFAFMGVLVAYNAVLSSRGMTHWLMYSAFTVGAINLVLDSLFVLGFHWGVRGIVWASLIGVATATTLSVWWVHRSLGVRFYLRGAWRDMRGVLRPMLRIGLPNALEPFSYCVQQTILSRMIIALGVVSLAAGSYAGRAQMFQITFSVALALGGQILMAHWMGAQRFDDVNRLFWKAIRWSTSVAAIYSCLMWLFADQVLGLFTSDPAVRSLGKTLLLVAMCYEPARAVNIVGGFSLRTVGDSRFPLIVGMIFIWGILPVIFVMDRAWSLTLVGFWMCFAADEILRAGINLWRWRTGRWKSMGIVMPESLPALSDPEALAAEA